MGGLGRVVPVGGRVAAVAAAFFLGTLAGRLLARWEGYHARPPGADAAEPVRRARVARVLGQEEGQFRVEVRLLSGDDAGATALATQRVRHPREHGGPRVGDRCLVSVETSDGQRTVRVLTRERDGLLFGLAAAVAVLLALTGGRKGLATAGAVAWAVLLLTGVLLPAVVGGAKAGVWCMPLAAAIAVPTLLAIGGLNGKSAAAIGGTLCGLVAGGVLSVALVWAMALTGLEVEFGPRPHLDVPLWFAQGLRRVDFGSLLVAGMLLAGLGAVMDVSMAVASTVAEVGRAAPEALVWALVRPGLAAGRDVLGVMVLTVAMVFVGGELLFLVSVSQTGWAAQWLLLGNYEELAAELARVAAAAVGMAACVPATAAFAALLRRRAAPSGEGGR